MQISDEAVEAAHRAICEDDLEYCLDWRGKCVKAVEAAAPHMLAGFIREGNLRAIAHELETPLLFNKDSPNPMVKDAYERGWGAGFRHHKDATA
jgi:hypothetical protein